jgi:hypothetical protein
VDLNEKQIDERPESIALGTDLVTGPRHPSPPVFSSFGDWSRSWASTSQAPPLPEPIIIQGTTPAPMTGGPLEAETHSLVTDLCLSSVPKQPVNAPSSFDKSHLGGNSDNPRKPKFHSANPTPLPQLQAQPAPPQPSE